MTDKEKEFLGMLLKIGRTIVGDSANFELESGYFDSNDLYELGQKLLNERAKVLDEVKNEILDLVKCGIFVTRNDLAEMVSDIIESHK